MSMPDARHAELEAFVLRGEIQLQVAIFLGVGRQLVGANIDLAPLEPLADIPNLQQARAPGREVIILTLRLAEPLPSNPAVRDFAMTVGARHVELTDLA